jgi:hypothetical protein
MADPRTRSSPVPRARAYPNGEVVPIDVLSATANAPTPQGRSPIYPKGGVDRVRHGNSTGGRVECLWRKQRAVVFPRSGWTKLHALLAPLRSLTQLFTVYDKIRSFSPSRHSICETHRTSLHRPQIQKAVQRNYGNAWSLRILCKQACAVLPTERCVSFLLAVYQFRRSHRPL